MSGLRLFSHHAPPEDSPGERQGEPAAEGNDSKSNWKRQALEDGVVSVALLLACVVTLYAVPQFEQEFFPRDTTLQHTPHTSTISMAVLTALCGVFPALCIAAFGWFARTPLPRVLNDLFAFVQAHLVNTFTTTFFKVQVGRPRPDLLARCHPSSACVDGPCNADMCQDDTNKGFESFFSGHTSTAFTGMCYLTIFLVFHLGPVRKGSLLLLTVCVAPLYIAAYVGVTRLQDNRHHWEDVVVGGLVGISCAYVCFLLAQQRARNYGPTVRGSST